MCGLLETQLWDQVKYQSTFKFGETGHVKMSIGSLTYTEEHLTIVGLVTVDADEFSQYFKENPIDLPEESTNAIELAFDENFFNMIFISGFVSKREMAMRKLFGASKVADGVMTTTVVG